MKTFEKNEAKNSSLIDASSHEITTMQYLSDLERYFSQYQHFSVKTAQSTVEMCRIVFEAKKHLKKEDFAKFCMSIAHKPEDATIRKYLAIGERYQQLIDCAQLLPNSWTSIYLITQIPADTFNALVATSSDMSSFTGKDIQKLIDGSKTSFTEANESNVATDSTTTSSVTEDTQVVGASADTFVSDASDDSSEIIQSDVSDSTETKFDAYIDAADDTSNQTSSSDDVYAINATNQLIDHVNSRISSNDIDDDDQSAYEVTMRFSRRPSDDAINEILISLFSIRGKYKLNFEIDTNTIEHV